MGCGCGKKSKTAADLTPEQRKAIAARQKMQSRLPGHRPIKRKATPVTNEVKEDQDGKQVELEQAMEKILKLLNRIPDVKYTIEVNDKKWTK